MKVTVTRSSDNKWRGRIRRTRRSEGNSVSVKGLTRADLRAWLPAEIEKVAHPQLPGIPK